MKKLTRSMAGLMLFVLPAIRPPEAHAGTLEVKYFYTNNAVGSPTSNSPVTCPVGGYPGSPVNGDGSTYVNGAYRDDEVIAAGPRTYAASNTFAVYARAVYTPSNANDKPSALKLWETGYSFARGAGYYDANTTTCSVAGGGISLSGSNAFGDSFVRPATTCGVLGASANGTSQSPTGGRLTTITAFTVDGSGNYVFTGPTRTLQASAAYNRSGSGEAFVECKYTTRSEIVTDPVWDKAPLMVAGAITQPAAPRADPYQMRSGAQLSLASANVTDNDTLYDNGGSSQSSQTVTRLWTAETTAGVVLANSFSSTTGATTTWTAPTLTGTENFRDIIIRCTWDDPAGTAAERDDPAVSTSFRVRVGRTVWDVGTPIGRGRDSGGNWIDDGRIISPINQAAVGYTPKSLYALPLSTIPFEVEAASDWDSYRDQPNWDTDVLDQDTLTALDYTWSCDQGGLFTRTLADGTTQTGTTVNGRVVDFKIPAPAAMGAIYDVKCTITNTHGETPTNPFRGSRTDTSIVRTQRIIIGGGGARLSIHKVTAAATSTTPQQTTEIDEATPIGGNRLVVLNLRLDQGIKVLTGGRYIRIKELPDTVNGVSHGVNKDHVDYFVNFANAGNWERLYDPDGSGPKVNGWWPAPEPPSNPPANTATEYRYKIEWYTNDPVTVTGLATTTLHGHNGAHTLSVESDGVNDGTFINLGGSLESGGSTGPWRANINTKTYTVNNLNITSASLGGTSTGYAPVKSTTTFPMNLTVAVTDDDLTAPMNLTATLRSTLDPTVVVRTLTLTNRTGASHTLAWDGKNSSGVLVPLGFYTFDVTVDQPADSDSATYRSTWLSLSSHDLEFVTPSTSILNPLPITTDSTNHTTANFTYAMNEAPLPNSVSVQLFDVDFNQEDMVSGLSDQVRNTSNPVVLTSGVSNYAEADIETRSIVTARDDRAGAYRDHKSRNMLTWNRGKKKRKVSHALEYVQNGQTIAQGSSNLYWMKRVTGSPSNTWSQVWSWNAISGGAAYANDPADAWASHHEGPLPLVLQIAEPKPYRVGAREATSEEGINIKAVNPETGLVQQGGYKYPINDDTKANTVFTNSSNSSQQRGDQARLLVHPDGSGTLQDQDVLTGSWGCIAIRPGLAWDFDNKMTDMQDKFTTNAQWHPASHVTSTWAWFPLFVYQTYQTGIGQPNSGTPGLWTQLYYETVIPD